MSRRLRGGLPIALPLAVLSCTDLSSLSSGGAADAAPDAEADSGAPAPAECAPGTKACNGGCVAADDPAYGCAPDACTPCSVPYASDVACKDGRCAVARCEPGRADCNGRGDDGCEADLGSPDTCNACGTACQSGLLCVAGIGCQASCPPGQTVCGASCVDLQTNANHCGTCATSCAATGPNSVPACAGGKCTMACNTGFDDCDPSTAGCEPKTPYYKDGDNDGYGAGTTAGSACTPPAGNTTKTGDCLDTDARVHPGQATYFATGYTNAGGMLSYDYNCNGVEEEQSSARGMCSPTCAVGYLPMPQRPLQGSSLYCGSTSFVTSCSGASGSTSACAVSSSSADGCR